MPHTPIKFSRRLMRYSQILGCLLIAFAVMSVAKPAHAAYVSSGTITLCHDAGSGRTVDWNTVAIDADTAATASTNAALTGTSVAYQFRTDAGATACSAPDTSWTGW